MMGGDIVEFKCLQLEQVVRAHLGIFSRSITKEDMLGLNALIQEAPPFPPVASLEGLEYATNLQGLVLPNNEIQDLSPLSCLTKLEEIDLSGNEISDLLPLAKLTKVKALVLTKNQITDVSPLEDLLCLAWLFLAFNEIQDPSPLESLPNLQGLYLSGNPFCGDLDLAYDIHLESEHGVEVEEDISGLLELNWLGLL